MAGSLVVVGVGIRAGAHVTREGEQAIRSASKLFYLVADPVSEEWIRRRNLSAESLADEYRAGERRSGAYGRMVARILVALRDGRDVCVAFYGHPGVFVAPAHDVVRAAREEGCSAEMLPGISAEDCLYADLGLDPGAHGCQSFEATDFLLYHRKFDPGSLLLLWQVGVIGIAVFDPGEPDQGNPALGLLRDRLLEVYPPAHEAILYEASPYPVAPVSTARVRVEQLAEASVSSLATLVVPPLASVVDEAARARLRFD